MKSASVLRTTWYKLLFVAVLLLVLLAVLVVFFPWDLLREPINRRVSAQIGRHFEITRRLDVKLGRITTVFADGITVANPPWARAPFLLKADSAEIDVRLWPLLTGKVVIARISVKSPQVGLEANEQGQRSWVLSRDASDTGSAPEIGEVVVDTGTLSYLAPAQGADIELLFSLAPESGSSMPLVYSAKGRWQTEPFSASGRTGGVLRLSRDLNSRFPIEVEARVGTTRLKAKGSVTDLARLSALEASFDLQGQNLEALYRIAGVALPATPPYKLRGEVKKQDALWTLSQIEGILGNSDMSGNLTFDQSGSVATLSGKLQSNVLDFNDLAPMIGLPDAPAGRKPVSLPGRRKEETAKAVQQRTSEASPASPASARKVLPNAPLDLPRLNAMNADVSYSAARIRHAPALPLDRGSARVRLQDGQLDLSPISLGVAGGTIAGTISVNSRVKPPTLAARLDIRGAQLNRLFPTVETSKSSLGRISGQLDLNGRGNSAAEMLGSASGDLSALMGRGEISNLLLELIGLDGAEIIKFLVGGDRNVQIRCAVVAFDVKQGLMTSRAIVLDTVDTVIQGSGQINLATETLDLRLDPSPKDLSILSLRSPMRVGGSFAAPRVGPEKAALAGRGALALALGLVNPLLALAATVETGQGKDADCAASFTQGKPGQARKGSMPPGSETRSVR
ncbi:MAG: AsmA family protein [Polaromonas sp.]|nr:AsmA family protein [Polaromonas sp.]